MSGEKGVLSFDSGYWFEGDFKKGQILKGKATFDENEVYEGQFQSYHMHGRGKYLNGDGTVRHDGVWKNGQPVTDDESAARVKKCSIS